MKRIARGSLIAAMLLGCGLARAGSHHKDSVKFSFVYVGCNRLQEGDWKNIEDTDPSSANLPQLNQTFADIASLNPLPKYFFFVGDLVVNLKADDGTRLKDQLEAWTPLFTASPLSGKVTLVPLPGNHEMLQQNQAGDEVPNPACDPVWTKWMSDNGFDQFGGNGPTPTHHNPDQLVDDQSKLTYSFDDGDTHFVLINTDTLNTPDATGWIAYHWIANDLYQAQKKPKIARIFVLGHKPMVAPSKHPAPTDFIFESSQYPLASKLLALLDATPKVVAYLCAHAHQWQLRQFHWLGAFQVIAGNAGSQLAGSWSPTGGPFYGFTLVKVYKSGKVSVTSYQRCVPNPYYSDSDPNCPIAAARPQPEVFVTR
jgi:hypothetical protein